MISAILFLISI